MSTSENAVLLEIDNLTVAFPTPRGTIQPVRGVSLQVGRGQILGLVGESGSGKSILLRALLGIVPAPGTIIKGRVLFKGCDLVQATEQNLQEMRGREIGMIFQEPVASLNPVLSVGSQLVEMLRLKGGLGRIQATKRAIELFELVGIRSAAERLRSFPHQFSGGMAQRAMIAIAIAADPQLLLADEPTTALDVSIQDQVLALLERLRDERGMAMIIVSHDIGVVARITNEVAIMYAGYVLERGKTEEVLRRPRHPYTKMLVATVPSLVPNLSGKPLSTISGQLPDLTMLGRGCPFVTRCPQARSECVALEVAIDGPPGHHGSACPFN